MIRRFAPEAGSSQRKLSVDSGSASENKPLLKTSCLSSNLHQRRHSERPVATSDRTDERKHKTNAPQRVRVRIAINEPTRSSSSSSDCSAEDEQDRRESCSGSRPVSDDLLSTARQFVTGVIEKAKRQAASIQPPLDSTNYEDHSTTGTPRREGTRSHWEQRVRGLVLVLLSCFGVKSNPY